MLLLRAGSIRALSDHSAALGWVQTCTVLLHESLLALVAGLEPVLAYPKAGAEVGMKKSHYADISYIDHLRFHNFFFFSVRLYQCCSNLLPDREAAPAVGAQRAHRPAPAASPLRAGKAAGLRPGKPRQLSIVAEVSSLLLAMTYIDE